MSREDSTATADDTQTSADTAESGKNNSENTASAPDTAQAAERAAATADDEQKPKRAKPKASNARKTRTVELTLTVTGTADGEWQAELKHGSKWVARGLEVPAAAVSRAAKELHDEISAPIDEVINAAREQQQARVAQLEAELEEARKALAHLDEN